MIIQQLSIFLENRSGQLAQLTGLLAENGINLRALNLAEASEYGIARLIVSKPEKAAETLLQNEILSTLTPVVMVTVPDRPGGLSELLQLLGEKNINVSYMYSIFGSENGKANMILRVEDPEKLETILQENGYAAAGEDKLGMK